MDGQSRIRKHPLRTGSRVVALACGVVVIILSVVSCSMVGQAPSRLTEILYIHGRDDKVVPPSQSEKLFKQSPNLKSARLLTSGGHNDALSSGGFPARIAMLRFLDGNF